MMNDKFSQKVINFLIEEFQKHAADIAIIKNNDGSYDLFDRYVIEPKSNHIFIVNKKQTFVSKTFSSLKNAVTWCIYDQRNKITESKRIEELDKLMEGIESTVQIYKHLLKNSKNTDNSFIYLAKMTNDEARKKKILSEMTDFIQESKAWQNQKFEEKRQKNTSRMINSR